MPKIKKITACEILDSRGNPTVEATVLLDNGVKAKASAPAGARLASALKRYKRDGFEQLNTGGKGAGISTDERIGLSRRAMQGDQEARNRLAVYALRYLRLASYSVWKMFPRLFAYEDFFGIGQIKLLEHMHHYVGTSTMGGFVWRWIYYRILDEARKINRSRAKRKVFIFYQNSMVGAEQHAKRAIDYKGHIKMMAAVQPFLSGAISKTVNLPKEVSVQEIENVYIEAWQNGLKAVALYRDQSKRIQPLSFSKKQEND